MCVLDADVDEGMHDKLTSAEVVLFHIQCCRSHLQPAGVQAWSRVFVFNAWTTHGRFGGKHPCAFCRAVDGDRLQHYASCSVPAFYGSEVAPHLWAMVYKMSSVECFLGADARFLRAR